MKTLEAPRVLEEPRVRRWTRDEYYKMGENGLLEGERVELIDGEVVEMSPQLNPSAVALGAADYALRTVFGRGYWVRVQLPLAISERSEPEPDLAVVPGKPQDYTEHPSTALLVVEVSVSSLSYDRGRKANLYASAGVEDYWVLNVVDRQLEVYRQPTPDPSQPFGFTYASRTVLGAADLVTPLAAPNAQIKVGEMLP